MSAEVEAELRRRVGLLPPQLAERAEEEWRRLLGGAGRRLTEVLADPAALAALRGRMSAMQRHAVAVACRLGQEFPAERLQEELLRGGLALAEVVALTQELVARWALLLPAQRATQRAIQHVALQGGVLLGAAPGLDWREDELPVRFDDLPERLPTPGSQLVRADAALLGGALVGLLALADAHPLHVARGEWLHAGQAGLVERLPGAWLPGRVLVEIGRAAGVLRLEERVGPGPELHRLSGELWELIPHLFEAWYGAARIDGEEEAHQPEANLTQRRRLRAGLIGRLRRLPVGAWIGLDDLFEEGPEVRQARALVLLEMHAFGVADLALPPGARDPGAALAARDGQIRVRITEAGAALLAGGAEARDPGAPRPLAGVQIHPDGEILTPSPGNHPELWHLARLAIPLPLEGGVRRWRLSEERWRVAQQAGTDVARLRGVLARASGMPLPEALTQQLEQWSRRGDGARIYAGFTVRRFGSAEARSAWAEAHPASVAIGELFCLDPAEPPEGAIRYEGAPPKAAAIGGDGRVEVRADRADLRLWEVLRRLGAPEVRAEPEGQAGQAGVEAWRLDVERLRAHPALIPALRARARSVEPRAEVLLAAAEGQIGPLRIGEAELLQAPGGWAGRLAALPELRPHLLGAIGEVLVVRPGGRAALVEALGGLALSVEGGLRPEEV